MSDSSGTPWTGRTLPTGDFAGDDGAADERLAQALTVAAAGLTRDEVVVAALAAARVLVPVVAVLGEGAQAAGTTSDKEADMAVVTLTGPDGRRALPVFTSVSALAAWDPTARPVPVPSRQAAVSAVAEGCDLLVLDPAGPVTYVVSRPAMWAIGAGRPWRPAHQDDDVLAAVAAAVAAHPEVQRADAAPGTTTELEVTLVLRPGLDGEQVRAVAQAFGAELQASDVVRERVEGLELSVRSA